MVGRFVAIAAIVKKHVFLQSLIKQKHMGKYQKITAKAIYIVLFSWVTKTTDDWRLPPPRSSWGVTGVGSADSL